MAARPRQRRAHAHQDVPVPGHEAGSALPIAVDQGILDEHPARLLPVEAGELEAASHDNGQSVQRRPGGNERLCPDGVPFRLAVRPFQQVGGSHFHPLRPHGGNKTRP